MKLYSNPFSRGTRPRWLLEELGVPYALVHVDMKAGAHKEPGYRAIHPLGRVPALVEEDGRTVIESGAICLYLADKYIDRGLAPAFGSPARGAYYQWAFYAYATLEAPVTQYFTHTRSAPEDKRQAHLADEALVSFRAACGPIEAVLATSEWLVEGGFGAADVLVGSILVWAGRMGMLTGLPALGAYADRCQARPAYMRSRT